MTFFDFFFHVWSVAVYDAFAACAFLVLKWTFVKTHECIFFEFFAFRAEFAMSVVVSFAIDFYHVAYGFFLSFHSFMFWIRWLRLHVKSSLQQISELYSHKGLP